MASPLKMAQLDVQIRDLAILSAKINIVQEADGGIGYGDHIPRRLCGNCQEIFFPSKRT